MTPQALLLLDGLGEAPFSWAPLPAQEGTGHLWISGVFLSRFSKTETLLFSCNLTGWNLGYGRGLEWPGASEVIGLESWGSPSRPQSVGRNRWLAVPCS